MRGIADELSREGGISVRERAEVDRRLHNVTVARASSLAAAVGLGVVERQGELPLVCGRPEVPAATLAARPFVLPPRGGAAHIDGVWDADVPASETGWLSTVLLESLLGRARHPARERTYRSRGRSGGSLAASPNATERHPTAKFNTQSNIPQQYMTRRAEQEQQEELEEFTRKEVRERDSANERARSRCELCPAFPLR